jgi:YVTN family beta-propeller protein
MPRSLSYLLSIGLFVLFAVIPIPLDAAQIVVFLKTSPNISPQTVLELESVQLSGESGEYNLEPLRSNFNSNNDAGQCHIISETEIPPGRYDLIRMRLKNVNVLRQDSETTVPVVPEGIAIPLSISIAPGEAEPVFLVWTMESGRLTNEIEKPSFHLEYPIIPPIGSLVLVSNRKSGNITVIDRYAATVVDVIKTGNNPQGMAYSPITQELYLAISDDDIIAVIDINTLQVVQNIPLKFGDVPTRLHLSQENDMLYVVNRGSNSLACIDIRSHQEVDRASLGTSPEAITGDDRTGNVYVSNGLSNNVSIYQPFDREITLTFSVDGAPGEIWVDARTNSLFLAYPHQRTLTAVDSRTGTRLSNINLCAPATGLAYNRVARQLLVSQGRCQEIALIRPDQNLELGSILAPGEPGLITIDPENLHLIAVLPQDNSLAIINLNSRKTEAVIEVGRNPYMAVIPD